MWHSMIGGGLVTQLCPALSDPTDYSPQHSSVQGIFQTRILEEVAISFSRETSPSKDWTWLSCIAGSLLHCKWILYQLSHQGSPTLWLASFIQHKSSQGLCCSTYQYFILFIAKWYFIVWILCCAVSVTQLCPTPCSPMTVTYQAPLSMEFSKQEYWSRLPFPTPGDLPNPEIKLVSLTFPALADGFFTTVPPGKPNRTLMGSLIVDFGCWRIS